MHNIIFSQWSHHWVWAHVGLPKSAGKHHQLQFTAKKRRWIKWCCYPLSAIYFPRFSFYLKSLWQPCSWCYPTNIKNPTPILLWCEVLVNWVNWGCHVSCFPLHNVHKKESKPFYRKTTTAPYPLSYLSWCHQTQLISTMPNYTGPCYLVQEKLNIPLFLHSSGNCWMMPISGRMLPLKCSSLSVWVLVHWLHLPVTCLSIIKSWEMLIL